MCGDSPTYPSSHRCAFEMARSATRSTSTTPTPTPLHPSAPVVPRSIAVGEITVASGRDVLTAIVAGYEVCCRQQRTGPAIVLYAKEFTPTATAGTFGAAAAFLRRNRLSAYRTDVLSRRQFGACRESQAAGSGYNFCSTAHRNKALPGGARLR